MIALLPLVRSLFEGYETRGISIAVWRIRTLFYSELSGFETNIK